MYKSPELTKFGTFREVTLAGIQGPIDGFAVRNDGCNAVDIGSRCS